MTTRHSKVPEITLTFWILNTAANTLGETGGDAVSMTLDLGYAVSTAVFAAIFLAALMAQIRAKTFHPPLYWLAVVAATTIGTTLADFADRSLGVGYSGGSAILFALLMACLGNWWLVCGSISINRITSRREETFYWAAILVSNTLGTALGDFLADDRGLAFEGGVLVLGAALAAITALYCFTRLPRTLLFWAAFILTCPLGACLGDSLTKPASEGGLNLDRILSSLAIAGLIAAWIRMIPARARGANRGGAVSGPSHGSRSARSAGMATARD